jgi:hypothetical protein
MPGSAVAQVAKELEDKRYLNMCAPQIFAPR